MILRICYTDCFGLSAVLNLKYVYDFEARSLKLHSVPLNCKAERLIYQWVSSHLLFKSCGSCLTEQGLGMSGVCSFSRREACCIIRLLLDLIHQLPAPSMGNCSWHVPLGRSFATHSGPAAATMSLIWKPRMEFPWRSWRKCLARGRSVHLFLDRPPLQPAWSQLEDITRNTSSFNIIWNEDKNDFIQLIKCMCLFDRLGCEKDTLEKKRNVKIKLGLNHKPSNGTLVLWNVVQRLHNIWHIFKWIINEGLAILIYSYCLLSLVENSYPLLKLFSATP